MAIESFTQSKNCFSYHNTRERLLDASSNLRLEASKLNVGRFALHILGAQQEMMSQARCGRNIRQWDPKTALGRTSGSVAAEAVPYMP
jgi:hypothetical protein